MTASINFLLKNQLKQKPSQIVNQSSGFTLIELLVGLLLAFLVLTPLLGFMINLLDTDRKEQAKTASEQEIQSALDYIARDLEQSVHIYDGMGLAKVKAQLPSPPTGTSGEPVLVFWKREFLPKAIPTGGATACNTLAQQANCDDAFVYSLVAYYLIKDSNCVNSTWSCTAQIGRFQVKDAVTKLGKATPVRAQDPGFKMFDLQQPGGDTFEQKMNNWVKGGNYDLNQTKIEPLIDYIDHTPQAVSEACPETARPHPRPDLAETGDASQNYVHRQVPIYSGTGAVADEFKTGSFYACVSTDKTTAKVFIRGNALARVQPKTNPPEYNPRQSIYFPTASIEVKGLGFLGER